MNDEISNGDFDPAFYRRMQGRDAVIATMTDDELQEHYVRHGRAAGALANPDALIAQFEQRFGTLPADFDEDYYLSSNPDVAHHYDFPRGGASHYLEYGRSEGRFHSQVAALEPEYGPLPEDFDEKFYLSEHADVRAIFDMPRGGAIHYLKYGKSEGRAYRQGMGFVYNEHFLHLTTNRIYDLPDVIVDADAPRRVNVLVPAFEFKSMSAGFFGVFQVARFIKSCGFNVRLVMFDNFYWNEAEFRQKLLGYPGMEELFDELEIEYIGERLRPLIVSPGDNCVATVWYSAYFAEKIMNKIGDRPFLYLIQDYETNFYAGSSHFSLADATYRMNFNALFSSRPLRDFFLSRGIGNFSDYLPLYQYFNNACASDLLPHDEFMALGQSGPSKLALYSRPVVNRNMFELAGLTLCAAYREGVFDNGEWKFYGIGLGDAVIQIAPNVSLHQLPRMNLRDYQKLMSSFDVGLCLMASPHPSLLPFDLGGSGAIVVTNSFATKQQEYFDGICSNVIARPPSVPDLVDGLRDAVARSKDRVARYQSAQTMGYPRDWAETFGPDHTLFIREAFAGSEA